MYRSWRAIRTAATTAVIAVAATAALAVVVDAAPAPTPTPTPQPATAAPRPPASGPARAAELPPVTEHALDPEVLAASASAAPGLGGGQQVTQTIQLTVVGGDLELVSEKAIVVLERVPGSARDWAGTLPPVRVVDARGTHEGWTVRWTVAAVELEGGPRSPHGPAAKVHVAPSEPVVVAGLPDGLAAGKAGPAVRHGRTLFSAAEGTGGGTYEAGGVVTLRLPASVDGDRIEVELAFSLG